MSLSFWAGLILFVAMTGPFGTYASYSFGQRLLAVAPLLLAIMLVGVLIRALVFSTLPPWRFRSASVLNAGLASLIIAPVLDQFLQQIPPTDTVSYPSMGELLLLVFSLSLGFSSLRSTIAPELYRRSATSEAVPEPEPQPEPEAPRMPRLLQRLDVAAPGDLWSISVRDHYVDVQTSCGVTSLLMRLSDAMAETDPVEGAQIHRSHWVAWAALHRVEREGAKLFVVLAGGNRLPVSKNHRDKLAARGLL
ncbi:MAG: LytTR family DNA-binding domain-containing protein [Cypionkella sp.]|uniref:LytTR family DNA-binding domain-containing protein n=1 Tax=Cypionkella sp. TaxID=2811411 RepID=UPI002AB92C0E|nr:LytTR family DNA-binding domain-containing protein [Cypionkella sp.]MDZ4311312.1 LytTR family DNA-binding domain-containing protein [Cypionkella sp.]